MRPGGVKQSADGELINVKLSIQSGISRVTIMECLARFEASRSIIMGGSNSPLHD